MSSAVVELPLIVAGGSVRAAAQSACRAGLRMAAFDLFHDADLVAASVSGRRLRSLRELPAAVAELPPSDWLYTGGLENRPAVVAAISRRHRLLGIAASALRRVRDPRVLQRVLATGPAPMPTLQATAPARKDGRPWLVKWRSSAGGARVEPYDPSRPMPRGAYLQEFVPGVVCGVSYLAADGQCRRLGVCRQAVSAVDPHRPYLYGGSQGPIAVVPAVAAALDLLGQTLTAEFDLCGLFGVDVIQSADGSLRTLEVNPRYTASMELLDRAWDASLIEWHVHACLHGRLPAPRPITESQHAKRILYVDAAAPSVVSPELAAALAAEAGAGPWFTLADLPQAGTRLRCGEPLCTILADAARAEELELRCDQIERRARRLCAAPRHSAGASGVSRPSPRRRRATNSGS